MSGLELVVILLGAGGLAGGVNAAVAAWQARRHAARDDRREDREDDLADLARLRAINAEALALIETYRAERGRIERLEADVASLTAKLLDLDRQHEHCQQRLAIAEARIAELGG